ncbi:hypothetical protein SCP_0214790 [Sparassis crispa]|uniref:Uncharacterized protein n=1 Tax=Sparassis crispa TaxID=139825 RepID=A0A401GDL3_9APHY|nr:hypothetical protein SCP_0214790 [Sparassis crispa]GBE80262.1 hypothetical protein SCP_0214790 [Sparassis crispa]
MVTYFRQNPVLRAKARFFIDVVSTKFVPTWTAFVSGKGTADAFVSATEQVTAVLPETGFALGECSTADIAVPCSRAHCFEE